MCGWFVVGVWLGLVSYSRGGRAVAAKRVLLQSPVGCVIRCQCCCKGADWPTQPRQRSHQSHTASVSECLVCAVCV